MNTKELDSKYIANTYARFPIVLERGKGSLVWDSEGREYIDMGSGIAVNAFGLADGQWMAAVTEQLGRLQHSSNLYYTVPDALLAEQLCERTGMKKVFFGNSGAEANECAIKCARKYAADKYGADKRYKIVTLVNSFHGRTVTTLAATGQDEYHQDFQPLTPGFLYAPANDCEALKALVEGDDAIAAIMFELVQGEGGVLPLTQEFVQCIADICRAKDILMVCDEVQTGNGRTGTLYAWMQYGIVPDIMTTAKGLGGGLPIGACLMGEKCENTLTPGSHGSTFGGNPAVCAGALNILSRIDDSLLAEVKAKSEYIVNALTGAKGVESVAGLGLMLGIKTVKPLNDIVTACRENGVLVLTAHGKLRLLPALNIPMELVEKAAAVIKAACA
ncbi:MAG TPA: aspartate aminotransferase family protein [Candidatus Scatomorpha gallistercoris]|nr:aspartate aminotransferase family protein [Candidatus Scatomorpha gallistercoris]